MNITDLKQAFNDRTEDLPHLADVRADAQLRLAGRARRCATRTLVAAAAAVVVLVGGAALGVSIIRGGSAQPASPNVSLAGRLDYACALVQPIRTGERASTWAVPLGGDADTPINRVVAAAGLIGAASGVQVPGYRDLSLAGSDLLMGVVQVDPALLDRAVDEFTTACASHGLPQGQPDVSSSGRVAYACAVTQDLHSSHATADSWRITPGPDADPALSEASGVAALLGAPTSGTVPGHSELSKTAKELNQAISLQRLDRLANSLATLARQCAES